MTNHLDREKCKNLAKWGLPQNVDESSTIYMLSDSKLIYCDIVTLEWIKESTAQAEVDYVIIPSLKILIEFWRKIVEINFEKLVPKNKFKCVNICSSGNEWKVWASAENNSFGIFGPFSHVDLNQALYSSLEFINELIKRLRKDGEE